MWGLEVQTHTYLTFVLEEKGSYTLMERVLGTHCLEGWVRPRAVINVVEKRNLCDPAGNRIQFSRSPTLATILTELPQNKKKEEMSFKRDKGCLVFIRSMVFLVRPSWLHAEYKKNYTKKTQSKFSDNS
jgi:hypothetical protein